MLTSPLFVLFLPAHAVFEIAGLELWMLPMYAAMDSTGMGSQPRRNTNPAASLYFVVFILFGSFLVMNLLAFSVVRKVKPSFTSVLHGTLIDNLTQGSDAPIAGD